MTTLFRTTDSLDVSSDGRNVEGIALAWDRAALVTDDGGRTRYREAFTARSVTRTLQARAERPLFIAHRHIAGSVGEVTFTPSAEGLVFHARMSDTKMAQEALERVSDPHHPDHLGAVSIGFRPIAQMKRSDPMGEITLRTEIALDELSLADVGQHPDAKVLAVRSEEGTPRLDALRRRKALLIAPR